MTAATAPPTPQPPGPDEDQQNQDVHGEMHQGEPRENSEAPEPGELILHGARERQDRDQGKRQVERTRFRLLEEGDIAVDQRTVKVSARAPPTRQIARAAPTPSETVACRVTTKYFAPSRAPGVKSTPRTPANTTHRAKLPRPSGNSV